MLCFVRRSVDLSHDIHPLDYPTERGESLTIRIAPASEVQFRLITNANEKLGMGTVRSEAAHGNRAVQVTEPGNARTFKWNRFADIVPSFRTATSLHHLDPNVVIGLIFHRHGSKETAPIKEAVIDILQKVSGRYRCVRGVNIHDKHTKRRFNGYTHYAIHIEQFLFSWSFDVRSRAWKYCRPPEHLHPRYLPRPQIVWRGARHVRWRDSEALISH